MSVFTKYMTVLLGIVCAVEYVLWDVLSKMFIEKTEIEHDAKLIPTYAVYILIGVGNVFFLLRAAVWLTRYFRLSEITSFPVDEYRFYRNFTVIFAVLPVIYAVYIYHHSTPFYEAALKEAIHKEDIHNYSAKYFAQLCKSLEDSLASMRLAQKIALGASCVMQAGILIWYAPKLVKIYQVPQKKKRRI